LSVALTRLVAETNDYLNAAAISDYCPNGLQVQGRGEVLRVVSGVTASLALIEAAIEAIAAGVDLYLTGEASEQTFHSARENGISFIAAGHHATERFGVQALGDWLAQRFGIAHQFIDCPNPF